MTVNNCVLNRNISALVNGPESKNLGYLKSHIENCGICKEKYLVELKKEQGLLTYIPKVLPSNYFTNEIEEFLPIYSKELSEIIDNKKSSKLIMSDVFGDLLSSFQNRFFLLLLTFTILFFVLINI